MANARIRSLKTWPWVCVNRAGRRSPPTQRKADTQQRARSTGLSSAYQPLFPAELMRLSLVLEKRLAILS